MGSEGKTAVVKTATHRHLWSKRRGQNGHPQAPVVKTAWSNRPSMGLWSNQLVVKTAKPVWLNQPVVKTAIIKCIQPYYI